MPSGVLREAIWDQEPETERRVEGVVGGYYYTTEAKVTHRRERDAYGGVAVRCVYN